MLTFYVFNRIYLYLIFITFTFHPISAQNYQPQKDKFVKHKLNLTYGLYQSLPPVMPMHY